MKSALLALVFAFTVATSATAARKMLIVVGAPGESDFQPRFESQAGLWAEAARKAGIQSRVIGVDEESSTTSDRDALEAALAAEAASGDELWIVMLGHGSFDGRDAKFNLRGPDLTAADLGNWAKRFDRPLVVLAFFAASTPFLESVSGPNRIVVTATRNAGERNYSRLGEYAAPALDAPATDLDGDGTISVLELALHSSRAVRDFYEADQRIVSEHAMIDDNGDGKGTELAAFDGMRAESGEGALARQTTLARDGFEQSLSPELRKARSDVERRIEELRAKKDSLKEDNYYDQLEKLLLEQAALYAGAGPRS